MNQLELNNLAKLFMREQTFEILEKLVPTLIEDLDERGKRIPGRSIHHIYSLALFECLVWVNSFIVDLSEKERCDYLDFSDKLKPKFMDIVEKLEDFQANFESEK